MLLSMRGAVEDPRHLVHDGGEGEGVAVPASKSEPREPPSCTLDDSAVQIVPAEARHQRVVVLAAVVVLRNRELDTPRASS
jgi:hypothetical protein